MYSADKSGDPLLLSPCGVCDKCSAEPCSRFSTCSLLSFVFVALGLSIVVIQIGALPAKRFLPPHNWKLPFASKEGKKTFSQRIVTGYNFVFFRRCLKPGPLVKEEPVADVEEESRPSSPAESLRSFKDLPLPPRPSLPSPPTSPAPSHPAFPPPPAGCHHHHHHHHHRHHHPYHHNQVVLAIVITTTHARPQRHYQISPLPSSSITLLQKRHHHLL